MCDHNRSAIKTVFTGSLIAGGTVGATAAVLTNAPVKQYALSTSLNCGMFSATFLIIRKTFVDYNHSKYGEHLPSLSKASQRSDLINSTLAGATTGGLLSAVYRGPKGVIPGAIIFGTICGVFQSMYSAGNQWRQNAIIKANSDRLNPSPSTSKNVFEEFSLPSWVPIRTISDEEYSELLDTRLKTLDDEMRDIEHKLKQKKQDN
ncbi:hypothetical protein O0I10_007531 [Lichtheimia ornata]|uniref:Uncharacterized protein n=1 Tax=Lichtheimia ornata TaxID=688661 RepID=A0AAD7V0Y5_9FUNG|nr:uncharacterized protein O0I10_007531 [Lichtheimia ornata]KAJ8656684.1 hypothetical protein O0I10_007531 [Lichtheimia ornata]